MTRFAKGIKFTYRKGLREPGKGKKMNSPKVLPMQLACDALFGADARRERAKVLAPIVRQLQEPVLSTYRRLGALCIIGAVSGFALALFVVVVNL